LLPTPRRDGRSLLLACWHDAIVLSPSFELGTSRLILFGELLPLFLPFLLLLYGALALKIALDEVGLVLGEWPLIWSARRTSLVGRVVAARQLSPRLR